MAQNYASRPTTRLSSGAAMSVQVLVDSPVGVANPQMELLLALPRDQLNVRMKDAEYKDIQDICHYLWIFPKGLRVCLESRILDFTAKVESDEDIVPSPEELLPIASDLLTNVDR